MSLVNTSARYGSLSIAMHWLMFLLLVAVYTCIELREFYPKGSDPREAFKTWHFTLGLTVFALIWLRLALRLFQVTPTIEPTPATWQSMLAKLVHIALYALMVGMPVVGWLVLSGEGKPIPFDLPALMAENESLAEELEDAHKLAGKVGYFLIGIHALAALVHHYFQKDNTLKRILPWG